MADSEREHLNTLTFSVVKEPWAGMDSNHQRFRVTDLQSAAFNQFGAPTRKGIVTALPVLFALYSFCVNASGHECGFVAVIASPVARHNIITYHSSFGSATNWVCPEGQDCQRRSVKDLIPHQVIVCLPFLRTIVKKKGEKILPERGNFWLV